MKITQIKITNFKSLQGQHLLKTGHPIIALVGENNTGKTTLFAAIEFLKNGVAKDKTINDYKNKNHTEIDLSVEVTIQGNIKKIIEDFSEAKFLSYIYDEDGIETIQLRRSSEKKEITQNGKPVQLDERKVTIFSKDTNQFENPTGFDKAIGSFFDTQFIWSDMQADDVVDFGSTKILGKLLKDISLEFQESNEWRDFLSAHAKAFKTGDNALSKKSKNLVDEIQAALSDFYGSAAIQLEFQPPEPDAFVKLGDLKVDDGVNTSISDKGSGMQRALALSLIKVYSDYLAKHQVNNRLKKPIFLFIDEPDISLHPKAQQILAAALKNISKYQQVFVTTHSPHFLKGFAGQMNVIQIFSKDNNLISIKPADDMRTFSFSPTLSEINYVAFKFPTTDFHNELYGYISEKIPQNNSRGFDTWVMQNCNIQINKQWIRSRNGQPQPSENVSIMTYIRHMTHHPENTHNSEYTQLELELSINNMLSVIHSPPFTALT